MRLDDEDEGYERVRSVRPYTLTGGRTRATGRDLPFEAIVQALADPPAGVTSESRRILELLSDQVLSGAEISAYLKLPFGVIRVLVGDLADEELVSVGGNASAGGHSPASDAQLLESVLDALVAL
jgi:hypothetical protein